MSAQRALRATREHSESIQSIKIRVIQSEPKILHLVVSVLQFGDQTALYLVTAGYRGVSGSELESPISTDRFLLHSGRVRQNFQMLVNK